MRSRFWVLPYPQTYDLQRLVALDYLLVHTGDIEGPDNLHPPTPMHSAELLVRRKLVEQSLLLMMTRDLVEREVTSEGNQVRRRRECCDVPVISIFQLFAGSLPERAVWLVETVGDLTDEQFKGMMRRFFDKWVEEFQSLEQRFGRRGMTAVTPRLTLALSRFFRAAEATRNSDLRYWPQCHLRRIEHWKIFRCRSHRLHARWKASSARYP